MRPDELFEGHPIALAVFQEVERCVASMGPYEVRTSRSQVAFRRRRGFAYVWRPGQYLRGHHAPAVLSIALDRRDPSPRFKQVVETTPGRWMHHLELDGPDQVDAEVMAWLQEAAQLAR